MSLPDKPRFYLPNPNRDGTNEILEEEFRHAKVLRLQSGDSVHVIDGAGKLYDGTIRMAKRKASIDLGKVVDEAPSPNAGILLAVAPTKNVTRFEWVIEKATELGVLQIIPLKCEHSERSHIKNERLEKIMISAAKQSKRLWLPELKDLTPFEEVLSHECERRFIAHCVNQEKQGATSLNSEKNLILIGPEGDFSEAEIEKALKAGFKALSLGANRLRTETAAVSICAAYHLAHSS